jgi:hypothetical protein
MRFTLNRRLLSFGILALGTTLLANRAFTQPPVTKPVEPTLVDAKAKDYGSRPVAYIYGNVPVTRADLAEFLIARGGYEKVELLVNKLIIEEEAKRRGITVTTQEMEAAFKADLNISNPPIKKDDFINLILPKYNKTYFEWMEDVVRPRLILGKMCASRVKVTEDDVKRLFERDYGEKKLVRIIIWPKGENIKDITKVWEKIRDNEVEFERAARSQANASLGATGGEIKPIARYQIGDGKDLIVEKQAFSLKEGEVSKVFETNQGFMVIKLDKTIPLEAKVKLADVKDALAREAYDIKQTQEIPVMFTELTKSAAPQVLLNGPPAQWRFEKSNLEKATEVYEQNVQPASATVPVPVKR